MRMGVIVPESRGFVRAVCVALGMLGCSPKSGTHPAGPPPVPSVQPGATHMDAGVMLPGIEPPMKPPPDAAILHPGEGGIRVGDLNAAKKIDILFMVDDSSSMSDKHEVLKAAIPDLLNRFVNPVCIDRYGMTSQPATADAMCPNGTNRQFSPIRDIHIGIVTSSLGTVDGGTGVCPGTLSTMGGNDSAHLVGSLVRAASVPTYPGGFLVWDPDQKATPPGQKDVQALIDSFRNLVDVIGEQGCGYENQLEAWYRFLVDPEPRVRTELVPCPGADGGRLECGAGPDGVDQTVLEQRAAFLRPDSLLVIVMLTDENDCSMTDEGLFVLGQETVLPPQASSACATNPSDPCCYPCVESPPVGCPNPDPVCMVSKTVKEDRLNTHCFDGKRRFGFDPLRPVQRYIDALTKPTVPSRSGAMVQNPLFLPGQRTPSQVFLVGITGVPWQDVATAAALDPKSDLRLKSARDLRDGNVWNTILGDPSTRTPPADALMTESITPRMGTNPVTGAALAPPTAGYLANPINGHERTIADNDDLQYACIFEVPTPHDCASTSTNCDCNTATDGTMNPLCQAADGTYSTTQSYAKAFPALRILQVLKGVGDAGVLASICPKNIVDQTSEGYGYRPVIGTLVQDVAPMLIK
jgi:hypothetical protein